MYLLVFISFGVSGSSFPVELLKNKNVMCHSIIIIFYMEKIYIRKHFVQIEFPVEIYYGCQAKPVKGG